MSANENSRFFPENSNIRAGIDRPIAGERVFDQSISIMGWIDSARADLSGCEVQAWCGATLIGRTQLLPFGRDKAAGESSGTFRLLARFPEEISAETERTITLALISDRVHTREALAQVKIRIVPSHLHQKHYGQVLRPDQTSLLHRENIYGSGPPVEEASSEAAGLVVEYLPNKSRVLDVGCGAGAYAGPLISAGHRWLGLEIDPAGCAVLDRRSLPYRRPAQGQKRFPAEDAEFDSAICIEVLEHVADPEQFVSEIVRVIRRRALFSVPNLEIIPYLASLQVVPWHLLEGDHKNFFTRASLHALLSRHFRFVEVFSYGEHPVATREGIRVHAHLFAVTEK